MKAIVAKKIISAAREAGYTAVPDFSVTKPPRGVVADWSTNVAMIVAGQNKLNPREVAEKIVTSLRQDHDFAKVDITGAGFINLEIKAAIYFTEIEKILADKENYGRNVVVSKKNVNVEYVSANPTGPLHVGNARGGPIGEAIANLFSFIGHDVTREFYVNDIGGQATKFGKSLFYWYEKKTQPEIEFPEDGYPGDYIKEISEIIQQKFSSQIKKIPLRDDKIDFFRKAGIDIIVDEIKRDCELLGIHFDKWFWQSSLSAEDLTKKVVDDLKSKNSTTENDGALWFKNSDDPDFQDVESVLIKSDGAYTYYADDIAYHKNKFDRGFDQLIDIWGGNHHGHVPRMKVALEALGYEKNDLEIILYQYIRLKQSGQSVKMGKRLGNFVTLKEVIEAGVQPDVFKYFILSQNSNTPFDFDLDLAVDTSDKNPVFYIKYAHARICSILKKVGEAGSGKMAGVDFNLLENDKEIALYKELVDFSDVISEIAENFQIQTLPHYIFKISGLFHDFYNSCKVIGAETKELEATRLSLILATKYIIANSLAILGIEAPEKM